MDDYKGLRVPALNRLLDEKGLPTDGLKADKVERLKNYLSETPEAGYEMQPEVITVSKQPKAAPQVYDDFIEKRQWAGIRQIYVCRSCGRQEDSEDDMILHILTHFPVDERESILNTLVKD